ncbi:rhomboid-like protein 20 isoform X3 [Prosopis cineraria]|uniref:rhomboid-like protein 20 isoform X3 n=1 Tax=Prosopis cineraria TaxID=364024 RepID=UPI0024102D5B|nr:rhomboid-like protein 20 isoform X3 [Prosopis cineraria]
MLIVLTVAANAPVTRTVIIFSAIFSIFFGIQGRLNSLDVFGKLRFWKLVLSIFAFSSTPELICGLYLLYYFRVFERQIGSNKYSVFVVFSMLVSLLFEVLALKLMNGRFVEQVSSGPYGLIFASFVPFFLDIPVSTRLRVLGFPFSDKSFTYLAGIQLLLSSFKGSILPGLCGILAGYLYRLNVFYIRKAKFPRFIASLFSRFFSPSMGSSRAPSTRNAVGNRPFYSAVRQAECWLQRNYPASMQSVAEPSEDSIATLVSMGFDRNSARQALVHARNDVNVATNILLEAQSH